MDVILVLYRCYIGVQDMLYQCYRNFSGVVAWVVTGLLQRCYRFVTRVLQGCYRGVTYVAYEGVI